MNALRMLVALGVALAAVPFAAAQEKAPDEVSPAPQQETKKQETTRPQPSAGKGEGMYRYVSGDLTMTHGDQVTIAGKNGQGEVKGTFLWMDPKSNLLYVRTKPGQPPVAVPAANVTGKGGVKFANNPEEESSRTPEVQSLEIYNGTNKSVHHSGPALSPAERQRLGEIDKAAADVAEKRAMVQSLERSLKDAGSESTIKVVQVPAAPSTPLPYWAYPFYDYYAPGGYYTPYYYPSYGPWFGYGYGLGYGMGYGPGYGWGSGTAAASPTVVVQTSAGNGGAARAELRKSLSEAQTALAQAQKQYAAVQNSAIYGPGGQIVAVRMPE